MSLLNTNGNTESKQRPEHQFGEWRSGGPFLAFFVFIKNICVGIRHIL